LAILKVARMGHPVLVRPAEPVRPDELGGARIQALIDDMIETMHDERGVGLAAPQVHESLRLFVMEPPPPEGGDDDTLRVLVNPVLTFPDDERMQLWEGCLSIPGIRGRTERRVEVRVECLDRTGAKQRLTFRDFAAAVVQHETDHLDGILFLQRMPDLSELAFEDELARRLPRDDDEGEEADGG
jgi:peptide deformylase